MSWNIKTPGDYINGPLTVASLATFNGDIIVSGTAPKASVGGTTYLGSSATIGGSFVLRSESTSSWTGTREMVSFDSVGNGADHRIGTLSIKLKASAAASTLTEYFQINPTYGYTSIPIGNVGIGVVPSPWRSVYRVVDLGARSAIANNPDSVSTDIFHNIYIDSGGSAIHKALGAAAFLRLEGNVYKFLAAPSASAGAVASLTTPLLINANAAIVLKDGNASANGVGLTFPAAQSASTDANTLDDYEEGTWTPTVAAETGTLGAATVISADYTKIGRLVSVTFDIRIDTAGTGTAGLKVSLPFSPSLGGQTCGAGREYINTGKMCQVPKFNATNAVVYFYDNTTVISNSNRIMCGYTYYV